MPNKPIQALCVMLVAVAVAGCTDKTPSAGEPRIPEPGRIIAHDTTTINPQPSAPRPAPAGATVKIDNFHFSPPRLEVTAGAVVTWINTDDVPHTATSKDAPPAFDSSTLDTDEKYSFTFRAPGTYAYYCKVHPHMSGTIVVR